MRSRMASDGEIRRLSSLQSRNQAIAIALINATMTIFVCVARSAWIVKIAHRGDNVHSAPRRMTLRYKFDCAVEPMIVYAVLV